MTSSDDKKQYSPGAYLKSQREKKGLSLQEIHEKTRIRPEVLKNIETGENLPSPAYLKGFLRIYARALDLDEAKLLREFFKKKPVKISSSEKSSSKRPPLFFFKKRDFSSFPCCFIGTYYFFCFSGF